MVYVPAVPRRTLLAPLAVVAVCAPPLVGLWRAQGTPMEEGFMLVFPELVLDGEVPNRDFLHLYGPGSLWVLAAVFEIFGVSLAAERIVGLLQHLGVGLRRLRACSGRGGRGWRPAAGRSRR